jgi:hypothetical protein
VRCCSRVRELGVSTVVREGHGFISVLEESRIKSLGLSAWLSGAR